MSGLFRFRQTSSLNFIAHHYTARKTAPDGDCWYFAGNIIPDLLAHDGEGRLHERHIKDDPSSFARGIGLHLSADRRFHTSLSFKTASSEAADLLHAAPFTQPLHRVFFLAHVFVEIALDGALLRQEPGIDEDLYSQLQDCGVARICAATAGLLEKSLPASDSEAFLAHNPLPDSPSPNNPLPRLESSLDWFLKRRYASEYRTFEGQAEALSRVSRRVGLPGFPLEEDRAGLVAAFDAFAPRIIAVSDILLETPIR